MSLKVDFFKFNKNPNSTKRPGEPQKTYNCLLIEPTSVVNPSIAIADAVAPHEYNYAYITEFSRYYFVNDWNYSGGRWFASLNVDVLASFKNSIGASEQYVLRSAAEYNPNVVDTLYPTLSAPTVVNIAADNPFTSSLKQGCYVVGIINNDEDAVGAVSYYSFTNAQFRTFCNAIMGSSEWAFSGITEISTELFKTLFNPFQYVASCMWFPIPGFSSTPVTEIPYGWWNLPVSCSKLTVTTRLADAFFIPEKHPQAESRGTYLNAAPYSRYSVAWPAFGMFPLDANIVGKCSRISVQCYIDAVSGKGVLAILAYLEDAVFTLLNTESMVGVPIQIAQIASDYIGAASTAIGGVASLFTGNIAGGLSSIGSAVNTAMPQVSTKGSNGMTASYHFNPQLLCEFYHVAEESNEHRGRPLCSERVVNTLPGYVMVADAEIEAPCTSGELERIKGYMNGGFYYE